ncbi:hypothetical protein GCM10009798_18590 [Nocardioides panacihumi]|uniref:DUF4328 domain-containing protein n=1 Tax=Nocardioides panacihumi TaxID=400774 RepID=A0ABP5C7L5_9ACTN
MSHPANWYPDPEAPQQRLRYWDGIAWTAHLAPLAPVQPRWTYDARHLLGTLSLVAVGLVTALQVLSVPLVGPAYDAFEDAARRGDDPSLVWTAFDTVGALMFPVLLLAWILTAMWLVGMRRNAEAIAPGAPHRRSIGWVWGGWVCPVVSLWFPYQVVRDIIRATRPAGRLPVGWWWTAFLVFQSLSNHFNSFVTADSSPATIHDIGSVALGVQAVAALSAVAAAFLWFVITRAVSRDQAAAASAVTATY